MATNIRIFADRTSLIAEALKICLETAAQKTRLAIALAGGNTPKPLYQALAQADTDWQKWHIFFGDERFVPHSDPQSNYRMVREAWLDHVPIPPAHIQPIPTDTSDPHLASQQYEQTLCEFFGIGAGEFPHFDIVLLGMGEDGHTASLFPFTEALSVGDRLVTVGYKDGQPRITLTVPTINHAEQIIFLVEGSSKAPALSAVLAETGDPQQYPARLVSRQALWLVDRAAAQHLQS
ncbi:MAG: 6-phosphogluconolactonase [Pseudanabaenaceae cyanobacterium]